MSLLDRSPADVWRENPLLAYAYGDFQDFAENFAIASGRSDLDQRTRSLALADFLDTEEAVARHAAAARPLSSARAPFSYAHRRGERLVLWLYGPTTVAAEPIAEFLAEHADARGLILRIDSPGGSIAAESLLVNALSAHRGRKLAIIDRACWSAAVLPAITCERVYIRSDATMLIHGVRKLVLGDATRFRTEASDMAAESRRWLYAVHRARPHVDRRQLARLHDADSFISATDAVALGLADRVMPSIPPSPHRSGEVHHGCASTAHASSIEDHHV